MASAEVDKTADIPYYLIQYIGEFGVSQSSRQR
jgi:hypothetical protein